MKNVLEKLVRPSDGMRACAVLAVRLALGWKLAYLGVWALTSAWPFSWFVSWAPK